MGGIVRQFRHLAYAATALTLAGCVAGGSPAGSGSQASTGAASSTPHLRYSSASNDVIQHQPRRGTCRAIGARVYERPDPACTPGALNPAVTQATIHRTICVEGWTGALRPRENITEPEKFASLAAYGGTGPPAAYEYDHFIPLELGGATNDARNMWPEPGASPNPKDEVEDALRQAVCEGRISLAKAQREIVANWPALLTTDRRRSHDPGTA